MSFAQDFPALTANGELIYLDSAATTQKPQLVIDTVANTYRHGVANPHRGLYDLGVEATEAFEGTRAKVADFIQAETPENIIFTSGTTESINLAAESWARHTLQPGDIIVTSDMEHHSNLLPWLRLRDEIGVEIVYISLDEDFRLAYKQLDVDFANVKLVAISHASNVLGTINPIAEIADYFRAQNSDCAVLVDAAQTAGHIPINVRKLGVDFLAFSAHKMCGPGGVGVLYTSPKVSADMQPYQLGGQMIRSVSRDKVIWADPPHTFEAGSQNLEGVLGLGAAIDYLQSIGFDVMTAHTKELVAYGLEKFKDLELYGPKTAGDRLAIFSFNVNGVHAHDVAEILNRHHIAVRAGHHCAEPLMKCMNTNGTVRASLYIYNDSKDIDALLSGLDDVKKVLHV